MWWKKKWLIIAVLGAVVLSIGILGGVAYAQSGSASANTITGKTFAARVANILGIDQAKVEEAFAQAQKEMQDEALTNRLDKLVEEGKITPQQADEFKQWWQARPENIQGIGPRAIGPRGQMGFGGRGFQRPFSQPGTTIPSSN